MNDILRDYNVPEEWPLDRGLGEPETPEEFMEPPFELTDEGRRFRSRIWLVYQLLGGTDLSVQEAVEVLEFEIDRYREEPEA